MNDKYETNDYCLASSLLTIGINLIDIKNSEYKNKFIFVFKNSNALQTKLKLFWSKQLSVIPQDFSNSQKFLKSSMYERLKHAPE